jgi:hypothetical protein
MAKQRLITIQQGSAQRQQEHSKIQTDNANIEIEKQNLEHQHTKSYESLASIDVTIMNVKKTLTDTDKKCLELSKSITEALNVKELMQAFLADYSIYAESENVQVMGGEDMTVNINQLYAEFNAINQE